MSATTVKTSVLSAKAVLAEQYSKFLLLDTANTTQGAAGSTMLAAGSALSNMVWSNSANYNIDYILPLNTTVNANSANWNYQGNDVRALTANYSSNYTTVNTNSANWDSISQISKSADYTTILSDKGKQIYHPSADTTARTWTIAANASVAYDIGTAITFVNDESAGIITIAINSDTLLFAGTGTTGSRTLAAAGIATALKMTATRWIISGVGLT